MLSLAVYLNKASKPRVLVRMPNPRNPGRKFDTDASLAECPQVKFVRIDGALFFGAVNYVVERLRLMAKRQPTQKHLVLFARTLSFIDVAGAEMLAQEARERRKQGGALWIHSLREDTREAMQRGGYIDDIGPEYLFESKEPLVAAVFAQLDRGICVRCDKRIFLECRDLPRVEIDEAAGTQVTTEPWPDRPPAKPNKSGPR
jgi:SulP family sulfate permease